MAKGQAQRRRAKNFLEAKETKSGRLLHLPPPPDAVSKKGKRNSDVSRSLQRMLELQALAQGPRHRKQGPVVAEKPSPPAAKLNAHTDAASTAAAAASLSQSRAPHIEKQDLVALQSQGEIVRTGLAPVTERKHRQQKDEQHAALSTGAKALKPRKKDFLKRRKLKKKGLLHLLDEEPEEDVEAELMQDRHKPRFGEQAMAPLKIHLKRKHWDSSSEQGRSSKRCTDIYERQMSDASRKKAQATTPPGHPATQKGFSGDRAKKQGSQAALKLRAQQATQAQKIAQGRAQAQAIEAYTSIKRPNTLGKASLKTLKQLVKKGEAAAPITA